MFDVDLRDCLCNKTFLLGWTGGSGIAANDRVTVKFVCFEMELSQQFFPRLRLLSDLNMFWYPLYIRETMETIQWQQQDLYH